MLAGERHALLRLNLGEVLYQDGGNMLWSHGGRCGWGTWKLLRQKALIQRRRGRPLPSFDETTVWLLSPAGEAQAQALRQFGAVGPGE